MRTKTSTLAVLALLASTLLSSAAVPSAAVAGDRSFQQQPGWLTRWNSLRAGSGLPALTEDPDRSAKIVEAVTYMAQNGDLSHELPDDAGDRAQEAASHSNLSQDPIGTPAEAIIDGWMTDPGHLLNMLSPELQLTGLGQAEGDGSLFSGAWTIPLEGDETPQVSYPYLFPGDGSSISLPPYAGNALPDPLTHCDGYQAPSGFPIMVLADDSFGPAHTFGATALTDTATGAAVEHCTLVGEDYRNPDGDQQDLFRSILRNTVSLIPRQPLPDGTYQATANIDGADTTWTFTIGGGGGPVGGPPFPNEHAAGTPSALSAAISTVRWPGQQSAAHAVLASAERFPDALAGTALTYEGPMLLTPQASLAPEVAAELQRVLAAGGTVYLLGGAAALSEAVESAVADLGFTPQRLSGPTRIDTAVAVANQVATLYEVTEAVIARAGASGADETAAWADSVAVGAYTARYAIPVLLTDSASLSPEVAAALDSLGIAQTSVVGGTAAVSDEVLASLPNPTRVAGNSRTGTAVAIATQLVRGEGVVVIDGYANDGWASGLAAAGLAADRNWSVLLANGAQVPSDTAAGLPACGSQLAIVGSPAFVQNLRAPLAQHVDPNC